MTIKSDINLYKVKLEIAELYMIESCFTAGMTPRDIYDALEKHSTLLLRELKQLVPNITDSDSLPSKVRKRREKRTARNAPRRDPGPTYQRGNARKEQGQDGSGVLPVRARVTAIRALTTTRRHYDHL